MDWCSPSVLQAWLQLRIGGWCAAGSGQLGALLSRSRANRSLKGPQPCRQYTAACTSAHDAQVVIVGGAGACGVQGHARCVLCPNGH